MALLVAVVFMSVFCSPALAGRKHIYSDLYNVDLVIPGPYQGFWPNDLHIVIFGIFPGGTADVIGTFANEMLGQVDPANIVYTPNWTEDPLSPGFGYDRLELSYKGPIESNPFHNMTGQLSHFGVHLRPCCYHVHIVVYWTRNGQAWWGPGVPIIHIYKIRVNDAWLVVVSNPTASAVFLDTPRMFRPLPTLLPRLPQLLTTMNPAEFGGQWMGLTHPAGSLPLEPLRTLTFRIPNSGNNPTPIVFQAGVRDASGTLAAIVTDRATSEWITDGDGTGKVDMSDFMILRSEFNKDNPDNTP